MMTKHFSESLISVFHIPVLINFLHWYFSIRDQLVRFKNKSTIYAFNAVLGNSEMQNVSRILIYETK